MSKQLLMYTRAIKLLPVKFYQEYGDQLIQAAQDLLSDIPNNRSKWLTWLQLWSDLLFTIAYQNIINQGEAKMTLLQKVGLSIAWLGVAFVSFELFRALRLIGMEWMNTAGFLRVLYLLAFVVIFIGGSLLMAVLSWFNQPRKLYPFLVQ